MTANPESVKYALDHDESVRSTMLARLLTDEPTAEHQCVLIIAENDPDCPWKGMCVCGQFEH